MLKAESFFEFKSNSILIGVSILMINYLIKTDNNSFLEPKVHIKKLSALCLKLSAQEPLALEKASAKSKVPS